MGLAMDEAGHAQWSHLVEHLTIRSTTSEDATNVNAETLPDHMRFDFYGTRADWRSGLLLHGKWLPRPSFTQQTLASEKPKVNREIDYTVKNLTRTSLQWRHGDRPRDLMRQTSPSARTLRF